MRSAVSQANQTYDQAVANGSQYGAQASTISSNLLPFLTQRLNSPQGYSQTDLGSMLASALGSTGGATSGITGQANLEAARSRNDAGFSGALAEAARQRTKANAGVAEGIQANNADVKLQQQSEAGRMLQSLFGTDVGAQSNALSQRNDATQTAVQAGQSGWFQNLNALLQQTQGAGSGILKLLGGG